MSETISDENRLPRGCRRFGVSAVLRRIVPMVAWVIPATAVAGLPLVAVRTEDQRGTGILRERAGDCIALTPYHVVARAFEITVVGPQRLVSKATLLSKYEGDLDLAFLKVSEPRFPCPPQWDEGKDLDDVLDEASEGEVESVEEDGSRTRRRVRLVRREKTRIGVRPIDPHDELFQTLSGSILTIRGRPVGMLMRVETDSGMGEVLRLDHLSNVIRSHFDVATQGPKAAAAGYTIQPAQFRALVAQAATVREQPDRLAASIRGLAVGEAVIVTGRVAERLWLRIELRDGTQGFIPSAAVEPL